MRMINVKAVNVDMDKIELLKKLVIENKGVLPYINLNEYNAYIGWVSDFNIQFVDGKQMQLDLKEEKDLFLLFVLAAVWSRSGRWENAAYFVTYLKYQQLDQVSEWNNKVFREKLKENRQTEAGHIAEYCKEIESRVKISFRKDIYVNFQ